MQTEIRELADWPGYGVDREGGVYSRYIKGAGGRTSDTWRAMKINRDGHGYRVVGMRRDG